MNILLIVFANSHKVWQRHPQLRGWGHESCHFVEANTSGQWVHIAGHKFLHGVPTPNKFGGSDKGGIAWVIVIACNRKVVLSKSPDHMCEYR
jgi:hypothetical protein